jgi:WD40 repeat protein
VVEIWTISHWKKQATFANSTQPLAFNHTGTHMASVYEERSIAIWDIASQEIVKTLSLPENRFRRLDKLKFTSDGRLLIGQVDSRNLISVWESKSGRFLREFGSDTFSYSDRIAISPDGRFLAAGSVTIGSSSQLMLWDIHTGQPLHTLNLGRRYRFGIEALDFSPNGQWLAVASNDGELVFAVDRLLHD